MLFKILESKFIFKPHNENSWWKTHALAPSAIRLNKNIIRVFLGCEDEKGISRIGYVDLDAENPSKVLEKSVKPVLDLGRDGTFDENGVFPAHACINNGKIFLYYTGFELGHKINHYNFGGLAISDDGINFKRISEAPILDRADEGLHVRAGQSVIFEDNLFKTVYSAGSGWHHVGGKLRPVYDVFYQESTDGISYEKKGRMIIKHDEKKEHGLGRPQIIQHKDCYFVFYTRRTLDMKYSFGASYSKDLKQWKSLDEVIDKEIIQTEVRKDFNSEMVYFPSLLHYKDDLFYLFYGGNTFGKEGMGYLIVELKS